MKRAIFIFILALCLVTLAFSVSATEVSEEKTDTSTSVLAESIEDFDIKGYVTEKLLPILISAFSGITGLIGAAVVIKKSVGSMRDTSCSITEIINNRELGLEDEVEEMNRELDEIRNHGAEILALKSSLQDLRNELSTLIMESHNMARMVTLGFMGDERAMRDGRATKIYKLLEKNNQLLDELGIKTDTYGRILKENEVAESEKA